MAVGSGAAARAGDANKAPAAAADALSTSRLESARISSSCVLPRRFERCSRPALHPEQPAVMRLEVRARPFDLRRIVFHLLDLAERLAAGLLLRLRVHRAQAPDVDGQLLRLRREAEALEQPGGIGI